MPKKFASKIAIAYVPVLHRGYLQFFKASEANVLYVIGADLLKKVDYIRKDLRALDPKEVVKTVESLNLFDSVQLLDKKTLKNLDAKNTEVILPDEDISIEIGKLLRNAKVDFYPIFLRWDRRSLERTQKIDKSDPVSKKVSDAKYMAKAFGAAGSSSDIWRRVGAVLISPKGKELGVAANSSSPSAHSPWMEGDPRNAFNQGVAIEMSVFMHAEAALIAAAAKSGISLAGATMYATTFPCPACAKLIAHSGIKNLFYAEGYGVLDGRQVLIDQSVALRRVPAQKDSGSEEAWTPYKKS